MLFIGLIRFIGIFSYWLLDPRGRGGAGARAGAACASIGMSGGAGAPVSQGKCQGRGDDPVLPTTPM